MQPQSYKRDSSKATLDVFRKAHKILNCWIKQYMPYTANILFPRKEAELQEKIKIMTKLDLEIAQTEKEMALLLEDIDRIKQSPQFKAVFSDTIKEKRDVTATGSASRPNFSLDQTQSDDSIDYIAQQFDSLIIKESLPDNLIASHLNRTAMMQQVLKDIKTICRHSPSADALLNPYISKFTINAIKADQLQNCQLKIILEDMRITHPFDQFRLYVGALENSDDDIIIDTTNLVQEQTNILKFIRNLIKNTKDEDLLELAAIYLLMKIESLLWFNLFEEKSLVNHQIFEQWAKIGLWLVEKKKALCLNKSNPYYNKMKQFCKNVDKISLAIINIYYHLSANLAINLSPYDLDLFLAENFLDIASQLRSEIPVPPNLLAIYMQQEHSIKAKIAYENKDEDTFLQHIDKAIKTPTTGITLPFFKVLHLAGDYCAARDPQQALYYYRKALELSKNSQIPPEMIHLLQSDINKIKESIMHLGKNLLRKLNQDIKAAFPECKIAYSKDDDLYLAIFFPLQRLPRNLDKIFTSCHFSHLANLEIFDNVLSKETTYTGFRLKTSSLEVRHILADLQCFLSKIQNALVHTKNGSHLAASQPPMSVAPFVQPQVDTSPLPSPGKEEVYSNSNSNGKGTEKAKSRKQPLLASRLTTSASATTSPSTPPTLYANDVGFNTTDNPAVTPIYCSRQAQQKRSTKLYVAWQGIPHVDPKIEKLFEGMLNPTPEGLVTARMINQAGAKLWKDPDNLGNNWNLSALRFKRKGHGSGWLRAITIPDQKVEVKTESGNTVSRYLFRLGLPKHK